MSNKFSSDFFYILDPPLPYRPTLLCKSKRQYLLTCKVSRYCLLVLHGSIVQLFSKMQRARCKVIVRFSNPTNTKHLHDICTMLVQRRRRWAEVVKMLYKCFVFAGKYSHPLAFIRIIIVCYSTTIALYTYIIGIIPSNRSAQKRFTSVMFYPTP